MPNAIDYQVEPRSRAEFRQLAKSIRKVLGLQDKKYIPIVELLDIFEETLKGFSYLIVPDDEMSANKHADINVYTGEVRIRESVYEGARKGNGRDRMTIAHEFAHFMTICFLGFKLNRVAPGMKCKTYCDPEWQAKCLAGELMIPYDLTIGMSAEEISIECGVSMLAAEYRVQKG